MASPSSFAPSKASQQSVETAPKLFDRTWEVIQKKSKKKYDKISVISLYKLDQQQTRKCIENKIKKIEIKGREKLIQLLEIIGDESLGRYNKNPKLRLQKIENMNKALEFIKRRGVGLTNIGAEDVVDGNVKLILGMIWSIILRFSIAEISEEGLTAKEGLLLWVQKRTTPYSQDFFVKDFTFSWQDGLPFCALIHRHRPDLLNYWELDKKDKHGNTALAFDIADKHLGIPKLFAVEDIVDVAKPDERSVMTYLNISTPFLKWARSSTRLLILDKLGTAGRRVGQFGQVMSQIWNMKHDYEQRARQLMANVADIQATWSQTQFHGYPDAKRQLIEFETYKTTTKRSWVAEKRELDTLLGNIQTKLTTYNLPPYTPPSGLTIHDVDASWNKQLSTEGEHKRHITAYIKEIKEVLKTKYANAANTFQDDLNTISLSLINLGGELEAQLTSVKSSILQLEPLQGKLREIEQLNSECNEANIEDNEYTIYSVGDLSFELGILSQSLVKKVAFIENQIVARTMTNITPQQLESFTETFRHFDKDNSNNLTKDEFKAALQAEGSSCSDAEVDAAFSGSDVLSFEKFIEFMRHHQEDKTTPEQLQVSFAAIGGDKDYITEADMYMSALPPTIVEYFKVAMPVKGDGFDYKACK